MRTFRYLVVGLFVLGLVAPAWAGHSEEALMKEVTALGDALTKALLADDVETMLGMYAEDAISLPNFSPRMDGLAAKKPPQIVTQFRRLVAFGRLVKGLSLFARRPARARRNKYRKCCKCCKYAELSAHDRSFSTVLFHG